MEKSRSIPVYMQIVEKIKQRIKTEEFKSGMLLPKEIDFAKEFGVTRSTLRNSLDVLEREGFIKRRRSKGTMIAPRECFNKHLHADLAVVTRLDLANPHNYVSLLDGSMELGSVIAAATKRGMLIRFIAWCDNLHYFDLEEILFRKGIDGFIFSSPLYLTDVIDRVIEEKIPHVLLESHYDKYGVNTVMTDDYAATRECVKKLYKLGHRKIGFSSGPLKVPELMSSSRRCYLAFLEACKEFGIAVHDDLVQTSGEANRENIRIDESPQIYSMLSRKSRPTAVITATIRNANLVRHICSDLKLRIPQDLSLICVGSNDTEFKEVRCSGYQKDYEILGEASVDSLMNWIADPLYQPSCQKFMPGYINHETTLSASDYGKNNISVEKEVYSYL